MSGQSGPKEEYYNFIQLAFHQGKGLLKERDVKVDYIDNEL